MSIKATSLTIDSMAMATESPQPIAIPAPAGIPLNPMLFPSDWSKEISLETRWLTDITRPANAATNFPEKLSLHSRPSRTLKARIVGMGKDECHAILQSALQHTSSFGAPVPIYADAAAITGVETDPAGVFVTGDFRFRRFFVGGRVAFYPLRVSAKRSANSVVFARLLEVSPDRLKLAYEHPSAFRVPTTLDVVAPCIDCELVPSSKGISQTSGVYELELSWDEIDGPNSLPGIWPPTSFDNADVLSPFCQVVDNLPVFPFDINWSGGIDIEAVRSIDSTNFGRTSLQEPLGKTYLRFHLQVMGFDRESAWKALRFFDAMRGRAGNFYLVHPQRPWTFGAIPALDRVTINPVGDARNIPSFFRRLAFFRSDGTIVTRTVTSSTDLGGAFQMTLSSNLPDSAFVDVQPISICGFESDAIQENWATIGVIPSLDLTILEEPDIGAVNTGTISYTQENPAFLGIDGLTLLLRAGAGCFDSKGRASSTWPAAASSVSSWQDMSPGPNRQFLPPRPTKRLVRAPGWAASMDLIRFPLQFQNNGQPAIIDPWFHLEHMLDTSLPIEERHIWGPNGWTLLLCFTPEALGTQADRNLVEINTPESEVRITFDRLGASPTTRAAIMIRTPPSAGQIAVGLTQDISILPYTVYLTLRVDGSSARVWVNGTKASTVSFLFPMVYNPSNYTFAEFFRGMAHDLVVNQSLINSAFGTWGCANLVASYNRALDIDEINKLHKIVADMYRTTQEISVLY